MSMRSRMGFTLIEILIAMVVAGLILPPLATAIYQMTRVTMRVNREVVVQSDIDVASSYFNRDLSQAQRTVLADGGQASDLRVDWRDQTQYGQANPDHYAHYYIDAGTSLLMRDYDGTVSIVARHVEAVLFARSGNLITVTITSTLDKQSQQLSYLIEPRWGRDLQ